MWGKDANHDKLDDTGEDGDDKHDDKHSSSQSNNDGDGGNDVEDEDDTASRKINSMIAMMKTLMTITLVEDNGSDGNNCDVDDSGGYEENNGKHDIYDDGNDYVFCYWSWRNLVAFDTEHTSIICGSKLL